MTWKLVYTHGLGYKSWHWVARIFKQAEEEVVCNNMDIIHQTRGPLFFSQLVYLRNLLGYFLLLRLPLGLLLHLTELEVLECLKEMQKIEISRHIMYIKCK